MGLNTRSEFDAIILGGGAAGLMCALTAGQSGQRVLVIECTNKLGKKILMSGGGRCNFTNLEVLPEHFLCANPHFVKSALKQYTQWDFIDLVNRHNIAYHEKQHGQLFCDHSAKDILNMLLAECQQAKVQMMLNCSVSAVEQGTHVGFVVTTNQGQFVTDNLVVATGGLSIPTLGGATGFGYQLAKQFGLLVNNTLASLVPMTLTGQWHEFAKSLSGVSVPVVAQVPGQSFKEQLLFTHRGLSGPVILQLSNYWRLGDTVTIDLLPEVDARQQLLAAKQNNPNSLLRTQLAQWLPKALVLSLQAQWWADKAEQPLQAFKQTELLDIAYALKNWQLVPSGTEGYRTAEVTQGGVDTDAISSKTMQVKHIKGLYFIGEVLDVTGHLGGFNFQWAWSSAVVAGLDIGDRE